MVVISLPNKKRPFLFVTIGYWHAYVNHVIIFLSIQPSIHHYLLCLIPLLTIRLQFTQSYTILWSVRMSAWHQYLLSSIHFRPIILARSAHPWFGTLHSSTVGCHSCGRNVQISVSFRSSIGCSTFFVLVTLLRIPMFVISCYQHMCSTLL